MRTRDSRTVGIRVIVAAVLAVAALGLGAPAAAAAAADDPAAYRPVAWMECDPPVGGELSLEIAGPAQPGAYVITGTARLEPCRPAKDLDAFTVATYATSTSGFVPRVRAAGGGLYQWLSRAGTGRGSLTVTPDVYAVCLAVDSDVRVQCFGLQWTLSSRPTGGSALTGLTPLSPQDPAVSWPAPLPQIPEHGGACPTCWTEHGVTG